MKISVAGHILPSVDVAYNLGSGAFMFDNVYLDEGYVTSGLSTNRTDASFFIACGS